MFRSRERERKLNSITFEGTWYGIEMHSSALRGNSNIIEVAISLSKLRKGELYLLQILTHYIFA